MCIRDSSWDGRLTTDSAAASIVTQTRMALWPLILVPKLGKDAEDYRWSESSFAEEEIVMHANPDWLPPAYKNWDALLTEAVRKGMEDGKAPSDVAEWTYGSCLLYTSKPACSSSIFTAAGVACGWFARLRLRG